MTPLIVLALFAAQGQTLTLPPIDITKAIYGGLAWVFGGLVAVIGWFLSRLATEVKRSIGDVSRKVDTVERETASIKQELVGMDGRNGMKSVQKRHTKQLARVDVSLALIAQERGIELPEQIEVD